MQTGLIQKETQEENGHIITRIFSYTFSSVLFGKLIIFFRKSLFRYVFAALLFSVANEIFKVSYKYIEISFVFLFLLLSIGFIAFGLLVIVVSSYIVSKTRKNIVVTISFSKKEILIEHPTGEVETKSWDWIRSVNQTEKYYFIDACFRVKPFVMPDIFLILSKKLFADEEKAIFETWLVDNVKIVTK